MDPEIIFRTRQKVPDSWIQNFWPYPNIISGSTNKMKKHFTLITQILELWNWCLFKHFLIEYRTNSILIILLWLNKISKKVSIYALLFYKASGLGLLNIFRKQKKKYNTNIIFDITTTFYANWRIKKNNNFLYNDNIAQPKYLSTGGTVSAPTGIWQVRRRNNWISVRNVKIDSYYNYASISLFWSQTCNVTAKVLGT
jgi:hypothetical protein